MTKEEYNQEPVVFCKNCLSLNIRTIDGIDYCEDCGTAITGETNIEHWDELYQLKYGKPLLKLKTIEDYE